MAEPVTGIAANAFMMTTLESFGGAGACIKEWLRMSFGLGLTSSSGPHSSSDGVEDRDVRSLVAACVPGCVLVHGQGARFGVSCLLTTAAAHAEAVLTVSVCKLFSPGLAC